MTIHLPMGPRAIAEPRLEALMNEWPHVRRVKFKTQ
jgi:hypothetical protein